MGEDHVYIPEESLDYDPDDPYVNISVYQFLAAVCQIARVQGFVSRAQASGDETSTLIATADVAWNILNSPTDLMHLMAEQTDADREMASNIIIFVKDTYGETEDAYLMGLRQSILWNVANQNNYALVASAYRVYLDACSAESNSEHIGKVGDSRFLRITFVGKSRVKAQKGGMPTYLYTFLESGKNIVEWFSTTDHGFVPECTYAVKANIVNHKVYRGNRVTIIANGAVAGIVN